MAILTLTIDGEQVSGRDDETLLDIAQQTMRLQQARTAQPPQHAQRKPSIAQCRQ